MSISGSKWRSITEDEFKAHTDLDKGEGWMCVRGIIYDVTEYASKHPGGAERIKRYCGKDATDTFNAVHAYVDVATILADHQIGVLKGSKVTSTARRSGCSCCGGSSASAPSTYFKQDSIVATYVVEFNHNSCESDWTVGITDKFYLHVFKHFNSRTAWICVYELPETLENDQLSINFRCNYKHIHITLRKPLPTTLWAAQTHGIGHMGEFMNCTQSNSKFDAYLLSKKALTPNILLFGVQLLPNARMGVPLGFHVMIQLEEVARPYTPVSPILMDKSPMVYTARAKEKKQLEELTPTILYFMIKIYPDGRLTKALDEIELDDGKETPTLKISTPYGSFNPNFLQDADTLFLLSAGTGISPMVRIIQHFWHEKGKLKSKRIALWHFVQKEHDLVWKKQFQELEEETGWFFYFPSLTQVKPESPWTGARGRISTELIKGCITDWRLDKKCKKQKAIICGPPGFNSTAVTSMDGLALSENIFVFTN